MPCFQDMKRHMTDGDRTFIASIADELRDTVMDCKAQVTQAHSKRTRGAVVCYPDLGGSPQFIDRDQIASEFGDSPGYLSIVDRYCVSFMVPVIIRFAERTIITVVGQPWIPGKKIDELTADARAADERFRTAMSETKCALP